MAATSTQQPPTLVLLHGLGADRQAFQRFARLLPDDLDVRPKDLLGHGDADKPEGGYALGDYARYLHDVLQAEGLAADNPPILVGHSLGAAVAVRYAAEYGSEVAGVALLDPPAGTGERTRQMLDAKLEGRLAETIDRLFPEFGEPLRKWTLGTWEQMAPGVARELNSDWRPYARDVRVPVVVIRGESEHGGTGEGAAAAFADAGELVIEGAGHYLHATHARQTAAALVGAVSGLVADRARS